MITSLKKGMGINRRHLHMSENFVGKKLINALKGNITIVSRKKNLNINTIILDLEKDPIPINIFKNIDRVYFLAGIAHDTKNVLNTRSYYSVNVKAAHNLVNLASVSGVKSFIYVSSVKAGKTPKTTDKNLERDIKKQENIYGKTKRKAELKILKVSKKTKMHISIIRPALVYGPNVKGNLKIMISAIKKGIFPPLPETFTILVSLFYIRK